jgi:hypothetical protein
MENFRDPEVLAPQVMLVSPAVLVRSAPNCAIA